MWAVRPSRSRTSASQCRGGRVARTWSAAASASVTTAIYRPPPLAGRVAERAGRPLVGRVAERAGLPLVGRVAERGTSEAYRDPVHRYEQMPVAGDVHTRRW